ncbi:MAG: amino acid ABC transporter substrate-binding protein [Actinomycetota bacterium]
MKGQLRKIVVGLALLGLILSACAPDSATEETSGGEESGPIKIGISLPLTGDFTEPGEGVKRGYDLWAKHMNENGGLLGREVELVIVDDGSDPNKVVSDYERLISVENVDLVFGPFSSLLVIPASEVAEKYEMLFVQPAGAAPDVFNRGLEYLFYAAPAVADDHGRYFNDHILNLPEGERPKTAAYPELDDPFAQATAEGIRVALEEGGIETVFKEVYPPDQSDFAPIASKIADSGAELVVGGTQYEDSVSLLRSLQELDYQPKAIISSTGPTLNSFGEAMGDAAEGIMAPVGYHSKADFPTNPEFVEAYEEEYGEAPSEDPANAYTVGQIVQQAVEEVGSVEDQDALRDYIRENEFETIVGPLSFNERGEPQSAHMILQWQNGEIEIVLPADEGVQTAEMVFPKPEW